MILGIIIGCIISSLLFFILFYNKQVKIHQINREIDAENNAAEQRLQTTKEQIKTVEEQFNIAQQRQIDLETHLSKISEYLVNQQEKAEQESEKYLERAMDSAKKSYEIYQHSLDQKKKDEEDKYHTAVNNAEAEYLITIEDYCHQLQEYKESFLNDLSIVKDEITVERAELAKIRATRIAAIEAQKKEDEIKQQLEFYTLQIADEDLKDAEKLERFKNELNNPRILSMLIWQTYYQKPMNTLCANVLGSAQVTGIYKITHIDSGMCYIGQARDVRSRFIEHIKAGLGIDTPAGNQLYKAMQKYGPTAFTWELLESCDKEFLDEKEAKFIEIYAAKEYGFNSTIGNGVNK